MERTFGEVNRLNENLVGLEVRERYCVKPRHGVVVRIEDMKASSGFPAAQYFTFSNFSLHCLSFFFSNKHINKARKRL